MKKHHFATDNKAGCSNPDSASVISASQPEKSQQRRLCALAIGVALLSILILALPRIPAAASAPQHKFPTGATAPWEKTAGPPGVTTNVIFEANNIVYAGTQTQGVYKSTDNGLNWLAANAGIERTSISDMIASGPNLLAAVKADCPTSINIFKSTDNGVTWTGTAGLAGNIVNSLAIKKGVVWAFFSALPNQSGVARSTDNGNTWQIVPSVITNAGESIVSDNAIIVAEDNFIWRSTDDGVSWDVVEQFALTGIASFAKAGTKLFGAARAGIESSTDNGANWSFEPFSDGAFSFSAVGSTIYLGSNSKVFKSTDLGGTWIDMSTGLGKGGIQALLYDGTNLFAGTPADAAGIYRSTNGGQSWDPAAAGLPIASEIRSLISFGPYVFAGMQGDGIWRSSDHGDTWSKTDVNNALLSHALVLAFCVKDNSLFAGAINGIYRSTDGGTTFERTLDGFPPNIGVTAYSLAASGGNVIAAVNVSFSPSDGLAGIFYSSDDGNNWHQATIPIEPTAVTAVASDGSSLAYAALFGQSSSVKGLYKSTDAGVTWSQRQALNVDIERLAANGNNVLAGDLFGAYYSIDFGESWAFSDPPGDCGFGCGIFTYTLRGTSIFAGDAAGMFLSTNSGATWTPINQGFPQCPLPDVEASCADDTYLFAGVFGEAVWRKLLGTGSPTPTASPTATVTATPSSTPTPTATATATSSLTPTPTATVTATPSSTITPRPTPTPRSATTPRPRPTPPPRP
jgi:photosystem II stability/assembly factor-like uncharacterized protein